VEKLKQLLRNLPYNIQHQRLLILTGLGILTLASLSFSAMCLYYAIAGFISDSWVLGSTSSFLYVCFAAGAGVSGGYGVSYYREPQGYPESHPIDVSIRYFNSASSLETNGPSHDEQYHLLGETINAFPDQQDQQCPSLWPRLFCCNENRETDSAQASVNSQNRFIPSL